MASVIAKWQKCGKSTCRCKSGALHGPYFWLVTYVSRKAENPRKGRYSWKYLGKHPESAWIRLRGVDERFDEQYDLQDLKNKITDLTYIRKVRKDTSSTESVLAVDEPGWEH